MLARDPRLAALRQRGLLLEDAATGRRESYRPAVVDSVECGKRFDLALVAVRRDQLDDTLPALRRLDNVHVVFFGNAAGRVDDLSHALGPRTMFGFPAAGGVRRGDTIHYVTIAQQRTMLAEPNGTRSPRVARLARQFEHAGFPTRISPDPEGWLQAHAAFVVPIAFALYRTETDAARLAADPSTLELMVRATRQAFQALPPRSNREIPRNLRALYLLLPATFAVRYWRQVLAGPRGELWFAAHTRAAPHEMRDLATALLAALEPDRATPALLDLIKM